MTKKQAITRGKHSSMYKDDRETADYIIKALEQQSIAEERYQDLVEYFGDKDIAKCVLEDREEFKKWLERVRWHTKKVDELARKLEQQPSEDCISRQAVLDKAWDVPYEGKYVQVVDVGDIQELPPVTPTFPKGATNGDMIKAMFPKCCSNMGNFDNGIVVDFMGDLHSFDMEWWNAPYKQGNEKWIPENISYDNVQEKVATQREVICGLNAMNDELQAKLDKIKQIVNEKGNMWGANVHERLKEILEQE